MRPPSALLALVPACGLASCAPPASEGGFASDNPAARLYAIERAAEGGDRAAIRDLVRSLDSADPLERMMAIDALRRITGETFGYRFEDERPDREAAMARWVAFARAEDGTDG